MEIQNQVSRILRDNLARLRDVLDDAVSQGVGSRGQVADRVCEAFDLRDGRGRWQRASCCRALSDLAAAGHVSLPGGQPARGGGGRARVLRHPVAPAVDVPGTVDEVGSLTLELVETDAQRWVWNTLMAHEHPRGAGPFVGPQLRYLVGSAHGWLGGVGFAASACQATSGIDPPATSKTDPRRNGVCCCTGTLRRSIGVARDHRRRSGDLLYEKRTTMPVGSVGAVCGVQVVWETRTRRRLKSPLNAACAFSTPRQNQQALRTPTKRSPLTPTQ